MEIQSIHNFVARGEAFRDDKSVPVTITGSYPIHNVDPAHCLIFPDMDKLPSGLIVPLSDQNTIHVRGRTDTGKEIWIPDFYVETISNVRARDRMSIRQVRWEGIADFLIEGDLEVFDASDGEIVYSILSSPTPVALSGVSYIKHPDGTISMWEGDEEKRKPIRWKTTIGEAEFIDTYSYHHNEKVGLNQAVVQIQRCQIIVRTRVEREVSLKSMLENLKGEFETALLLLSFLGRMRVGWYEAKVDFYPDDNLIKDSRSATVRRRQWLGYRYEPSELRYLMTNVLVRPQDLRQELFQQLLINFEASPYHDTVRQAIIHLLVSHERAYLESQYTSAFTALECLVYGLGKSNEVNNLLGTKQFEKLSKKLRQFIRDEIQGENTASGIIKKLPELTLV